MSSEAGANNRDWFQNRVEEALLKQRSAFIFGEITQKLARQVTQRLLVLASESDEDIRVYINSQGGHVEAGDSIFDFIRFIKPRVRMIGTGWVASAGALIYVAPPREDRFCLPNTRFMIHQPLGGVGGSASDVKIEAEEIVKTKERLNAIFAEQTGQSVAQITKDSDRNFWMNSEEAIRYGLAGKVLRSIHELG